MTELISRRTYDTLDLDENEDGTFILSICDGATTNYVREISKEELVKTAHVLLEAAGADAGLGLFTSHDPRDPNTFDAFADVDPYVEPLDRPGSTCEVNKQALADLKSAVLAARDIEELDPGESYAQCVEAIGKCWQNEIDRSERFAAVDARPSRISASCGKCGAQTQGFDGCTNCLRADLEEARRLVRLSAQENTSMSTSLAAKQAIARWDKEEASGGIIVDAENKAESLFSEDVRLKALLELAGVLDGKYTSWAQGLSIDRLKAVLWAVGEFVCRGDVSLVKNLELGVMLNHPRQFAALDSLRRIYSAHGETWGLSDVCTNSSRAQAMVVGEAPNCEDHGLPRMPKGTTVEEGYYPCRVCEDNAAKVAPAQKTAAAKNEDQAITHLGEYEGMTLHALRWFSGESVRHHYYGIAPGGHVELSSAAVTEARARHVELLEDACPNP